MDKKLRHDADKIIAASIKAVLPDEAVRRALEDFEPGPGRTLLPGSNSCSYQHLFSSSQKNS